MFFKFNWFIIRFSGIFIFLNLNLDLEILLLGFNLILFHILIGFNSLLNDYIHKKKFYFFLYFLFRISFIEYLIQIIIFFF